MKKFVFIIVLLAVSLKSYCWGFFAHRKINNYAVFLLPPQMIAFYKQNINFISEHATDPDSRRNVIPEEAPRHYIDIDHYGKYPFAALPRRWDDAVCMYGTDTLARYGVLPWYIHLMLTRLTEAFKEKNTYKIIKYSADIGHYIADAHVPLHVNSNHNGQLTDQVGIHAFWESRVPELLAEKDFDFFIGKAVYLTKPNEYMWQRVLESAKASDSVLTFEKALSKQYSAGTKYAFEPRNGITIRQYSTAYTTAYNEKLNGMVERRMRDAIFSIASYWYTAWVNAGQPNLTNLALPDSKHFDSVDVQLLNQAWKGAAVPLREHE
jgi:hypothetical protein